MSDERETTPDSQAGTDSRRGGAVNGPAEGPRLLTVEDLADWLRVSTRTVWRLEAAGKLPPCVRIGRVKRWADSAVRGWIEAGCPTRSQVEARRAFEAAGAGVQGRHPGRRHPIRG